ncbi:hypothetical protein PYK79_10185 [Streptomyces sp. ID05-04B]|uniref:hypothetical protein n=1 Tax=Streptomyces sp. ID05-04B TaxID=3028661 RepID=UPI0029C1ED98|nr:hypothetical protein [Streptomyces sp. ID05-04B]MDX5563623.1 hypothetical protein [Streptomyces sp. ID05-04B]
MSVVLIGRWDAETLEIEESHTVGDGDQEAIDTLLSGRTGDWWSCEYLVDLHRDAVQLAYEGLAPGQALVDEAEGFDPSP